MQTIYPGFLKRLFVFSLLTALVVIIISHFLPRNMVTPAMPYLFLFFIASTLVVFYIMIHLTNKKPATFISGMMIITIAKVLFFAVIIILYILKYPTDKIPFVITFLVLYMLYTIFEVIALHSYVKKNDPEKKSS